MPEDLKVPVLLTCPSCGAKGQINFDKKLITNSDRGITAINIVENLICIHSFVAYIDNNYTLRDSFICDFKVELPQVHFEQTVKHEMNVDFDVEIVKINLKPTLMVHILKGLFYNKQVALIIDYDFIFKGIINFFSYIFENTFNSRIISVDRQEYRKLKKNYKDYLVLDGVNILHDKDKIITDRKLKIESLLAQKFYSEDDAKTCLLIIKNEVEKAFFLSKSIKEFIESLGLQKNDKIDTISIKNMLKEKYSVTIDTEYLNFLIIIVKKYFKTDVPIVYKNLMGFF